MDNASAQTGKGPQDDVDPRIRLFLQRMNAGYAAYPELPSASLPEARRIAEAVRAQWSAGGPGMASVEELHVGALQTRIRILRPVAGTTLPALVYLHGGGWTMFSIDTHDRLMREYAARAGVAVVAVDYSLSPEARFPRALEETVDVIGWLRGHGDAHGIESSRMAIGGDSAGANLSVASQLHLRAAGHAMLSAMLLNYGVYTDRRTASWDRYDGPDYMLESGEMQRFWDNYLRSDDDRRDPLAMPLLADLRGLPPAFMAIAECDILADGNHAMAEALREAGVDTDARTYRGATHSFLEAMSIAPLAGHAIDDAAAWLRQQLGLA
ncbi:alpha/beta hydrolase [Luteimonas aestuarii]|uniref:Alpha/beta hydrolase n=1 Tax=Luteimonas aestuarii TaxID=453837 RepID=A0A4R5TKK9_9GAMM|nr:alpha/beta hydrolase fold domain-containing protein [Luteimonas aestuarii]TDK23097.1 alpha/beta hydrolase [Luteimonas aestuarii]